MSLKDISEREGFSSKFPNGGLTLEEAFEEKNNKYKSTPATSLVSVTTHTHTMMYTTTSTHIYTKSHTGGGKERRRKSEEE